MSKVIQVVGLDIPKSDWNQTDETKLDYIKNKPELGVMATKNEVTMDDLDKTITERLDSIPSIEGLATEEYVSQSVDNLAPVAKSGSFNDLKDKPSAVFTVTDDGVLNINTEYSQEVLANFTNVAEVAL